MFCHKSQLLAECRLLYYAGPNARDSSNEMWGGGLKKWERGLTTSGNYYGISQGSFGTGDIQVRGQPALSNARLFPLKLKPSPLQCHWQGSKWCPATYRLYVVKSISVLNLVHVLNTKRNPIHSPPPTRRHCHKTEAKSSCVSLWHKSSGPVCLNAAEPLASMPLACAPKIAHHCHQVGALWSHCHTRIRHTSKIRSVRLPKCIVSKLYKLISVFIIQCSHVRSISYWNVLLRAFTCYIIKSLSDKT